MKTGINLVAELNVLWRGHFLIEIVQKEEWL